MERIVFLDADTIDKGDIDWSELKKLGKLETYGHSSPDEGLQRGQDAKIVIVNKYVVDESVLDSWTKCELIVVAATGYNNIDIKAARSKNIIVCNVAGYSTSSVVQHVFASILALLNHTTYYFDECNAGRWTTNRDFCFLDHSIGDLSTLTMGVIGAGTIGTKVASIASAFDMKVLIVSKYPDQYRGAGKIVDLSTCLKASDIVSIHVPLNDSTRSMISHSELSLMKDTAILINTSRGPVVDEAALYSFLTTRPGFKAVLDVLKVEPQEPLDPLNKLSNCYITPHIAWANKHARQLLLNGIISNIKAYAEGHPTNLVN